MLSSFVKTGAIAAALILATAGAAFADTAWAESSVNVRANHSSGAPVISHLYSGEQVWVTGCVGSFCRIEHPGTDGWVKASYLDFHPPYHPPHYGYGYGHGHGHHGGPGVSACLGGPLGSFCVSD